MLRCQNKVSTVAAVDVELKKIVLSSNYLFGRLWVSVGGGGDGGGGDDMAINHITAVSAKEISGVVAE